MDWNYSAPLSDALLAARNNQTELFDKSPIYRPYFSSYDPLITKFRTRPTYYNRPINSLFDDIDELALQVETENLLTSRFRPINQLNYVPSLFNKSNQLDNDNDLFDRNDSSSEKSNQIPQQPPKLGKKLPNGVKNVKKNTPQSRQRDNQFPIEAHNSQQQRFIQFQQRIAQQQQPQQNENNISELELLKIRQQQDRQQLLASLNQQKQQQQQQQITNQNIYAPFFQPNYFKAQKQYSETSIPSTNADPLNSNNPTPPLFTQRNQDYNKISKLPAKKIDDDDPGSYLNALKETRLREQRLAKDKYTTSDYKKYQKNYGFGRDFLPFESETKEEKTEKAKKRDEYAKQVKERNTHLNERYVYNNDVFSKRQVAKSDSEPSVNNKRAQNRK